MEKGLVVKKEIFIQRSKEKIRDHYDIDPKVTRVGWLGNREGLFREDLSGEAERQAAIGTSHQGDKKAI